MAKSQLKFVPSQKEFFKLVGALKEELPKIDRRAAKVCAAEGRRTAGCFDYSVTVEQWFNERGYFARSKQGYFNGREYHWWTLVPVGRAEFIVDLTRDQFVTGATTPRVQWFHPRSADAGDYADQEDE